MKSEIPKMMRAVVYRGKNDLRLEQLPVPRTGPDELLVKVAVCGVCPTDIKKIQHGTLPPPRVFGHETAGTIVRVGRHLSQFKPGQRVALHHHVPCMKCRFCRHAAYAQCPGYKQTGITAGFEPAGGGYAEYVRVMSFVLPGVVPVPKKNEEIEAAMLEPVNTVLKAVRRLQLLPGDRVLVAGQGPVGLIFTRLLALEGARVWATDLMPHRLKMARSWGAEGTAIGTDKHLKDRLWQWTEKQGLDAVVIAVPSDNLVQDSFDWVRGGGKILLFAHTRRGDLAPLDLAAVCVDEKDLVGSYSSDFTLQREVARLVFSRRIDVRALVTDTFPLERADEAVRLAAAPAEHSLKIVVRCDG